MKTIKRIFLSLAAVMLLLCSSIFAQTLTSGIWQLQNPGNPASSEVLLFNVNKTFMYSAVNLRTQEKDEAKGTYVDGTNTVTLIFDIGESTSFNVIWLNDNKLALQGKSTLYFGKMGSPEDRFMSNYLNSMNNSSNYYFGGSSNTYQQQEDHRCYTCRGLGSCPVCDGTGIYSAYGYSHTCSACSGTGKCWKCGGTGRR